MSNLARASIEFHVPFHDIDMTHAVWHGFYLKYLELARTALMRKCDLDVMEIVRLGYRMVVIESKCRHSFPLHYGDHVRVDAFVLDADIRLHIGYEIHNLTHGKRAARASTTLATLDSSGKLLYATPTEIREKLTCTI